MHHFRVQSKINGLNSGKSQKKAIFEEYWTFFQIDHSSENPAPSGFDY